MLSSKCLRVELLLPSIFLFVSKMYCQNKSFYFKVRVVFGSTPSTLAHIKHVWSISMISTPVAPMWDTRQSLKLYFVQSDIIQLKIEPSHVSFYFNMTQLVHDLYLILVFFLINILFFLYLFISFCPH